jgi:hypothetical protein
MKSEGSRLTGAFRLAAPALLVLLTGCSQTVWVKTGAPAADFEPTMEQCLSAAYLQAPTARVVANLGSGVVSPSFTTCSGPGISGSCVTSRGQFTRPLSVPYDANARVRTQIFRQCMYAAGWSEQVRTSTAADVTPDTDWTKGFDTGMRDDEGAQCSAPLGIANAADWSLGCRSGQKAR